MTIRYGVDNDLTEEEIAEFAAMGVDMGASDVGEEEAGAEAAGDQPAAAEGAEIPGAPGAEGQEGAAAPEGAAEGEAAAPGAEAEPKMVPLAALHAERARFAEATRKMNLLKTRTDAILAARTATPPPMPDLETQPEEYITTLEARLSAYEAADAEARLERETEDAMATDEQNYLAVTPEYQAASEHYVQTRAAELLIIYTPEQARQILTNEMKQVANQAWSTGVSFAERVHQLAKARGFTAAPPAPAVAPQPAAAPGAARPAAPAAVKTAAPTPAAVLAAQRAGKEVSRSLSIGGGAPAAELNAQAMLDMTDDEFEAALKLGTKSGEKNFQSLFTV